MIAADPRNPLRYAAAVTTLCPMMAVLGAKRPQDRAWQWVVLALLATLWLPAAQWLLLESGEPTDLFLAWPVLLAILVLLGPLNYLPTRNWLAALLVAAGQGILLAPFIAPTGWSLAEVSVPVSMTAFLFATGIVWSRTWRNKGGDASGGADRLKNLNTTWLCFRDAFGAFWAVRAMQRVNQGVDVSDPALTLTWHGWEGFPNVETEPGADIDSAVLQAGKRMRTAMRRFVQMNS
jgi:hypothetical protein